MGLKSSKVFAARDEQEEIKASGDAGYGATEETDKPLNDDNVTAVNDNVTTVNDNDGDKLDQETTTHAENDQTATDTIKGEYGDPHHYDPDFKGPIKQRSCTDIICLLLFVAFIIGWIFIGSLAYRFGDPEALMVPTDSLGRKCGRDPAVKRFPYLHFFDITKCANPIVLVAGCPTQQVCVRQCPTSNFFASPFALKEDLCTLEVRREFFCAPEVNATAEGESGSFQRTCRDLLLEDCAPYTINSAPIFDRCMPNIGRNQTSTNGTLVDDNNELIDVISLDTLTAALKNLGVFISIQGFGESVWTDLQASWWVIVSALIICMVVSFLWIVLMRWFTGVLVWVSLFGSLAAIVYGCVYTYMRYDALRKTGSQETVTLDVVTNNLGSVLEMKDTWLAFFILLAILGCVMLLLILILFKRLRIAIEVIEEASKAVTSTLFSLFYPIYPWIVQLSTVIVFVAVALHIASMSTKEYRVSNMPQNCTEICPQFSMNNTCDPQRFNETCQSECPAAMCTFYSYRKYKTVPYLQLYNLFALLWLMFFASAMGQMVLAGAFASWYFTFDKSKNLPMFPLLDSTHRTVRYHIGTLAFGSLLVAIIRLIRLILDYIQKKCAKYPGSQVVQCLLCACKCCMWCLETFLRFINRNAYIMCAIYGKNFCTSAKDAFSLLMRNALRVLAVNSVCDFLLFLGKVLITASVTVGSFYFLDSRIEGTEDVVPETQNSWVLILTIGLGCYFITSLFFSVYAMAVDTIFLCFLEDIERNDGSVEKPYFMSKDLMKLIGKRNKARMPTHSSTSLDKQ